jgi:copper oxidase (laccase) domain-containing protein
MILSPGYPGVAFTTADEGDIRGNPAERVVVAERLGIPQQWAVADQVHGRVVVRAETPVNHGEADALFTTRTDLPLAVFTADCLGVALISEGAVGVAHSGWRGVAAGVVPALLEAMTRA